MTWWSDCVALLPDPATRIVDVGCGNGDVLGLLRRAGYTNLLGVDPAEHSAAAARRLYDVEVVPGSVLSMPPGAAQSGCIVLSAVLEHVREVAAALREVSGMLAADGLLYVEVPDLERFARYESVPFQQFSVEHINYFTSGSLARAAAGAGLRLARTWTRVAPHRHHPGAGRLQRVHARREGASAGDQGPVRSARGSPLRRPK